MENPQDQSTCFFLPSGYDSQFAMENPNHKWRFLAGKIIYFYGPSIHIYTMAMLNNQRVCETWEFNQRNMWRIFFATQERTVFLFANQNLLRIEMKSRKQNEEPQHILCVRLRIKHPSTIGFFPNHRPLGSPQINLYTLRKINIDPGR